MTHSEMVYCDCGHLCTSPVHIKQLEVPGESITACGSKCTRSARIRELVEMTFGPEMEVMRQNWRGKSKAEREKISQQILKKETQYDL